MKRFFKGGLLIVLCLILVGCGIKIEDNKINMPSSSRNFEGENYKDVIVELEDVGFTNIKTELLDDITLGWFTKDGEVEEVAVAGDTTFSRDSKFDADVEIVVSYHTFSQNKEMVNEESENAEVVEQEIKEKESETSHAETEQVEESVPMVELEPPQDAVETAVSVEVSSIPTYSGKPYVEINNNIPYFADNELSTTSHEHYTALDPLGRTRMCMANIGTDIMPTEERGSIGSVKPTGWHSVKYNGIVDGNYLYNRCHLIGYQLTGENANTKNLITGTRYLNIEGMLPFENMVADYVKETGNHVMYRVNPVFEGDNLLASGVLMEAKSVEDNGDGILFNVYCYNVQPGIAINYSSGDSKTDETMVVKNETLAPSEAIPESTSVSPTEPSTSGGGLYAVNGKNGKIHIVGECSATGSGNNAMTSPFYFNTYEEAESHSITIKPGLEKKKCGNCW